MTRSKARALNIKLIPASPQKVEKRKIPSEERTDLTRSKRRKLNEDISVTNIVGDHCPNTVVEKSDMPTKKKQHG